MKKIKFMGLLCMLALLSAACGGAATPTSVPATEAPTEEATVEAQVATEEAVETQAATEGVEVAAATSEATQEADETQAATEEVAAATSEATVAATASDEIVWTCPEDFAGQTLSIYNWGTYIADNTVPDFERLCNVTVNYDTFDNNEAMIARLRQSNPGYDVAFANTYAIDILNREGLLTEINPANVPNLKNIGENYLNLEYDPDNTLTVPYLMGSMGVAVNTEKVTEPITTWQQVFDYDGPVAWIDDSRAMLAVALKLTGADPNSTNPEEIQAAKDYLVENSANVVVIADDDGQTLLERGEVDIAIEYSGDIYQLILQCECDKYAYYIPDEGSVGDLAVMFVPTDAPNVRLAEAFMDYILDPKVNADIVEFTTYATPNQAAIDSGLIDEALLTNPAVFPTEAMMQNLFFSEDVADAQQAYNDAWDELMIQVGS